MNIFRESWDSRFGALAGGQGRKSELFSSKGDEPAKVLFPPPRIEAWIEQVFRVRTTCASVLK